MQGLLGNDAVVGPLVRDPAALFRTDLAEVTLPTAAFASTAASSSAPCRLCWATKRVAQMQQGGLVGKGGQQPEGDLVDDGISSYSAKGRGRRRRQGLQRECAQ